MRPYEEAKDNLAEDAKSSPGQAIQGQTEPREQELGEQRNSKAEDPTPAAKAAEMVFSKSDTHLVAPKEQARHL